MHKVLMDGGSIIKSFTRSQEQRDEIRKTRTSPADVISLSGCKNYQTSADTVVGVNPFYVKVILGTGDGSYELGFSRGVE
jgi:hypothetical protein